MPGLIPCADGALVQNTKPFPDKVPHSHMSSRDELIIAIYRARQWLYLPEAKLLKKWVRIALAGRCSGGEIVLRIVDEEESAQLNNRWRGIPLATNVLSFPAGKIPGPMHVPLGDLVLCAPVVEREAGEQGKSSSAHWAHIVIHGTLHLLGYDHEEKEQARQMEALEIQLLQRLYFPNPYAMS